MLNTVYQLKAPRQFEAVFKDIPLDQEHVLVRPTHLSICHADQRYFQGQKAWIIRTTINACKDHLKSHWRKTTVPIEAAQHVPAPAAEPGSILASVNLLPPKYRAVIYLHYYEGYTAPEIAQLLGRLPSTVNTQLRRGREQLKTLLEKEGYP